MESIARELAFVLKDGEASVVGEVERNSERTSARSHWKPEGTSDSSHLGEGLGI